MEETVCAEEYDNFKEHLIEGKIYCFRGVHITLADEKFKLVPYYNKMFFTNDTTLYTYLIMIIICYFSGISLRNY